MNAEDGSTGRKFMTLTSFLWQLLKIRRKEPHCNNPVYIHHTPQAELETEVTLCGPLNSLLLTELK